MTEQPTFAAATLDMGALLEFSRLLNEQNDAAAIYNNLLFSMMGKMGLASAAVALPDSDGRFMVTYGKGAARKLEGQSIPWNDDSRHGVFQREEISDDGACAALIAARIEQVVPIRFGPETFALLLLGNSITHNGLGPERSSYALLMGAITAIALEGSRMRGSLHDANRKLERRNHRLRSLFEAGKEFNALLEPGAILRLLGYSLMGEMAIQRFAVALCDTGGYYMVLNRFKEEFPTMVLEEVGSWGTKVLRGDNELTAQEEALYSIGVRATTPMEVQGSTRGLLIVGERFHLDIDDEDMEYLCSLANLAVGALENARLLEETIVKQRMEEDLRIAAEIQQGLLPRSLPSLEGFEFAAETISTHQVGGDCYDVIELGDSRVLMAIADVSGKGTPASLLMANMQAAVRALAHLTLPLDELTARVNDVIYHNTSADKFITAFFGILDAAAGTFSYVNAGHNPPFHFSESGVQSLDHGGVILGIMPSLIPYEVGSITLAPGDLLLLYTDGVSEAMNPEREEYGEERLCRLLHQNPRPSAEDAIQLLRDDLLNFTSGAAQSDDITMLALRRN